MICILIRANKLTIFAAILCSLSFGKFADADELGNFKCIFDRAHADLNWSMLSALPTFDSDFRNEQSMPGAAGSKWFINGHGDFGTVHFYTGVEPQAPFSHEGGRLQIKILNSEKKPISGLLQTVDRHGHGFAQAFGYFEMRAAFSGGGAIWPAFWLKARSEYLNVSKRRPELDVFEGYGSSPTMYHSAVHIWAAENSSREDWGRSCIADLKPFSAFDGNFHTYGALIAADWTTIYFDRREIIKFKTPPGFGQQLYPIVDLSSQRFSSSPKDVPAILDVDYVKVWSLLER